MKKIIVGATALGRELYTWLVSAGFESDIVGFIDNKVDALDGYDYPIRQLGSIDSHIVMDGVEYYFALMDPDLKRKYTSFLKSIGCRFSTFIHPTAILGCNVKLGEGVIVTPGCILTCDIEVGDFVFLNTQTTLGHDVKVGSYTSINGKVEISGFVEVGEGVTIGSRVVILPKKKIASGAIIGAGSVVVGNIKQPITVFGNPAKRI